ncbi:hypothetical protein M0812_14461 [Anaeramoeba flamelloides]|uniref:Uncharacterized protein n=1 Tax=Anaeramoeba flamelloides TaxID=1746091 RepID=A0AAV7ZGD5_9EUKA|nr:hypothetical protein M0812_14461 [Anaeramoeba flamelloides]
MDPIKIQFAFDLETTKLKTGTFFVVEKQIIFQQGEEDPTTFLIDEKTQIISKRKEEIILKLNHEQSAKIIFKSTEQLEKMEEMLTNAMKNEEKKEKRNEKNFIDRKYKLTQKQKKEGWYLTTISFQKKDQKPEQEEKAHLQLSKTFLKINKITGTTHIISFGNLTEIIKEKNEECVVKLNENNQIILNFKDKIHAAHFTKKIKNYINKRNSALTSMKQKQIDKKEKIMREKEKERNIKNQKIKKKRMEFLKKKEEIENIELITFNYKYKQKQVFKEFEKKGYIAVSFKLGRSKNYKHWALLRIKDYSIQFLGLMNRNCYGIAESTSLLKTDKGYTLIRLLHKFKVVIYFENEKNRKFFNEELTKAIRYFKSQQKKLELDRKLTRERKEREEFKKKRKEQNLPELPENKIRLILGHQINSLLIEKPKKQKLFDHHELPITKSYRIRIPENKKSEQNAILKISNIGIQIFKFESSKGMVGRLLKEVSISKQHETKKNKLKFNTDLRVLYRSKKEKSVLLVVDSHNRLPIIFRDTRDLESFLKTFHLLTLRQEKWNEAVKLEKKISQVKLKKKTIGKFDCHVTAIGVDVLEKPYEAHIDLGTNKIRFLMKKEITYKVKKNNQGGEGAKDAVKKKSKKKKKDQEINEEELYDIKTKIVEEKLRLNYGTKLDIQKNVKNFIGCILVSEQNIKYYINFSNKGTRTDFFNKYYNIREKRKEAILGEAKMGKEEVDETIEVEDIEEIKFKKKIFPIHIFLGGIRYVEGKLKLYDDKYETMHIVEEIEISKLMQPLNQGTQLYYYDVGKKKEIALRTGKSWQVFYFKNEEHKSEFLREFKLRKAKFMILNQTKQREKRFDVKVTIDTNKQKNGEIFIDNGIIYLKFKKKKTEKNATILDQKINGKILKKNSKSLQITLTFGLILRKAYKIDFFLEKRCNIFLDQWEKNNGKIQLIGKSNGKSIKK